MSGRSGRSVLAKFASGFAAMRARGGARRDASPIDAGLREMQTRRSGGMFRRSTGVQH